MAIGRLVIQLDDLAIAIGQQCDAPCVVFQLAGRPAAHILLERLVVMLDPAEFIEALQPEALGQLDVLPGNVTKTLRIHRTDGAVSDFELRAGFEHGAVRGDRRLFDASAHDFVVRGLQRQCE